MLPWVIATCLTPCWRKKSFISCCTFGLVVTSVATQRFMIGSAPSYRITPAAIFVVVLSSGPYRATVAMRGCGGRGKAVKQSRRKCPRRTEADIAETVRRHDPGTEGRADDHRPKVERAA